MKRLFLVLALVCLTAAPIPGQAGGKLRLAVSIAPQKYLVERLGGDLVRTTVMLPAGASPAVYEPRPSQMLEISDARAYLAIGVPFERAWLPRMLSANPRTELWRMDQDVPKKTLPGSGSADRGQGVPDPHIWLSPPLARIMADNVLAALSEIDPENARTYAANHASLVRDIEALDRDIRAIFAGVDPAKRRFMVFHPAWGYFAEAYGLTQIPIQAEGKEPGPRTLAGLISEAKNLGVRVIFVQPEFSERSAEVIARAIGGRVQAADPLAPDWLENLKQVAGAFKSALR